MKTLKTLRSVVLMAAVAAGCAPSRPQLVNSLEEARTIVIVNGWSGRGCSGEIAYTLHRTPQGFEGNATARSSGRPGGAPVRNVTVSGDEMRRFLRTLVDLPLAYGPYQPAVTRDNYPDLRVEVTVPGGQVTYFTRSATPDGAPWGLRVSGDEYTIPSGNASIAFRRLSDALQGGGMRQLLREVCQDPGLR